jgi:hypothetical protein
LPDGAPPFLGVAGPELRRRGCLRRRGVQPAVAAAVADVVDFADAERLPTAFVEDAGIVG